jgi:hypothetical protein
LDKDKQFDALMERADGLLSRYSQLTKDELDELAVTLGAVMQIGNERHTELLERVKENDIVYDQARDELNELRNSITIMEAFILEKGLKDDLMAYAEETLQEFSGEFRPNLTLIQ